MKISSNSVFYVETMVFFDRNHSYESVALCVYYFNIVSCNKVFWYFWIACLSFETDGGFLYNNLCSIKDTKRVGVKSTKKYLPFYFFIDKHFFLFLYYGCVILISSWWSGHSPSSKWVCPLPFIRILKVSCWGADMWKRTFVEKSSCIFEIFWLYCV